jgi:hypothetical protein
MNLRYWDGSAWTPYTAPRPVPSSQDSRTPAWLVPTNVSGWAVASGYLGLVSLIFLGVPGPFAIASGILGLRQIARQPGLNGTVRAWVGIVTGTLGTMLLVTFGVAFAFNSWTAVALGAVATLIVVALIVAITVRGSGPND